MFIQDIWTSSQNGDLEWRKIYRKMAVNESVRSYKTPYLGTEWFLYSGLYPKMSRCEVLFYDLAKPQIANCLMFFFLMRRRARVNLAWCAGLDRSENQSNKS